MSVSIVETYLSMKNFCAPLASTPSLGLIISWKDMRPMRATESIVVMPSADTHIVMKQAEKPAGRPKMFVKNVLMPAAKIWNGVPCAMTPFEAAAQAMARATTPSMHSQSIAP